MVMVVINSHRLRKEEQESRGHPIETMKRNDIRMISKMSMIVIGIVVWLIRCILLGVIGYMKEGISGKLGCRWSLSEADSIERLRAGLREKRGIKGVVLWRWTSPSTPGLVTAGICVGGSIYVLSAVSSNLLISRGSIGLGYTFYRGQGYRLYRDKLLPFTRRTARELRPVRLSELRGSYVFM